MKGSSLFDEILPPRPKRQNAMVPPFKQGESSKMEEFIPAKRQKKSSSAPPNVSFQESEVAQSATLVTPVMLCKKGKRPPLTKISMPLPSFGPMVEDAQPPPTLDLEDTQPLDQPPATPAPFDLVEPIRFDLTVPPPPLPPPTQQEGKGVCLLPTDNFKKVPARWRSRVSVWLLSLCARNVCIAVVARRVSCFRMATA